MSQGGGDWVHVVGGLSVVGLSLIACAVGIFMALHPSTLNPRRWWVVAASGGFMAAAIVAFGVTFLIVNSGPPCDSFEC